MAEAKPPILTTDEVEIEIGGKYFINNKKHECIGLRLGLTAREATFRGPSGEEVIFCTRRTRRYEVTPKVYAKWESVLKLLEEERNSHEKMLKSRIAAAEESMRYNTKRIEEIKDQMKSRAKTLKHDLESLKKLNAEHESRRKELERLFKE